MNIKDKIKEYWETHLPQSKYSNEKLGTKASFDRMEERRYNELYAFFPEEIEFDKHRGEKVLEIGCGRGTDILQFAKNGSIVTAIDLTENAISITKDRFRMYGLKGNFRIADAENLPFADNTFDFVFSVGVLHHIPNTKKAIAEAYRVCKPNGKVIILLYAKGWKHYLIRVLLGKIWPENKKDKETELWGCPFTSVYNKREMKNLFNHPVELKRWRMGVYFDYKSVMWGFNLMPDFIIKIMKMVKLERILGEDWIAKGIK